APYELAEALGDGDEPALREALSILSEPAAEPAADRVRAAMRRAGLGRVPARPRASTLAAPARLTRRQLEVLALIESGLSNAAIGVTWLHSYVTTDKERSFCIYDGPDPEAIRLAAKGTGLPIGHMSEVSVLSPYFFL